MWTGRKSSKKLLPACCRNRRYNGLDRHNRCWMVRRGTSLLRRAQAQALALSGVVGCSFGSPEDSARRKGQGHEIAPVQGFCSRNADGHGLRLRVGAQLMQPAKKCPLLETGRRPGRVMTNVAD